MIDLSAGFVVDAKLFNSQVQLNLMQGQKVNFEQKGFLFVYTQPTTEICTVSLILYATEKTDKLL